MEDITRTPIEAEDIEGVEVIDLEGVDIGSSDVDLNAVDMSSGGVDLDAADVSGGSDIELGRSNFDVGTMEMDARNIKVLCGSIGEDGDGIQEITVQESTADGGQNVVTIVLSSGERTVFSIRNGSKGSQGEKGQDADVEGCNAAIANAEAATTQAESAAEEAENVDADLTGEVLTITNRQGEQKTLNVKGPKGETTMTSLSQYTLQQYLQMRDNGQLENMLYSIYKDGVLIRVYWKDTLVGKKAEDGETATIGATFPLVFPIIFA